MTDWKEITDPEELFRLKREGWEIDVNTGGVMVQTWKGFHWDSSWKFRARYIQPKMKKVKMLCWYGYEKLIWRKEYAKVDDSWKRVPAEDKEVEVVCDE